ncbi:MAG: geranyl transferase [Gracilibacter sp. BRH_c7a]|nr:MAG: geranyl transferase [Gracilibacter sp. BRH_c7a]
MFKTQYDYYFNLVEQYLNSLITEENSLGDSMNYSLVGAGKRVRPVLALASIEIVGGQPTDFVREASAIELIHTYSLIHDDLPAMDDDDFRRGKPSNHKKFGEATAILAGDALLTYSFELLAQSLPSVSPERQLRIIRETAQAAGFKGMVGGQALDTLGDALDCDLDGIQRVHNLKTGALLIASARLGAILGGGTEKEISILTQYASLLGLAFQIKDDILDVIGDKEIIGKPVGSDEKQQKATYPVLLGLEGAQTHLNKTITKAKDSIEPFGDKNSFLLQLADYVANRHS